MTESPPEPQASALEQWFTCEFEPALGGDHRIEQLREDLHTRYTDDPAVRRHIDCIAEGTHARQHNAAHA